MAIDDGPAIIGGGPSGLAAAIELRRLGIEPVTVIEREREPGGIPRHSAHTGFGLRDLRRVMSGPRYARRYAELAADAGVELVTETMVTGASGGRLQLTSPGGREELEPAAVVLATGCRERPRAARLIPGSRPAGVMTTSTLQQLVHLRGQRPGRRAMVVGAEHVSFSAVQTLAHAGASTAALVTELPRHQSVTGVAAATALRYRARVRPRTAIAAIHGTNRVEQVDVRDLDSGAVDSIACDLVVFTADWIPDHELAVAAGLELDPGSGGPRVDPALRTELPGAFAAGNLLHPAETADVCALDGRHAAAAVAAHLRGTPWPRQVAVSVSRPLSWVAPNLALAVNHPPPRGRFLIRSSAFLRRPRLQVTQAGTLLWGGRLRRLVPGRSASIPAGWMGRIDPEAGPVRVQVR
jgi:thioredoxin reductase